MDDDLLIARVRSQTIPGIPGRGINTIRTNHFIVDDSAHVGGPGEAPAADEIFLSGISACAALMVGRIARQEGIAFEKIEAEIEGIRTTADPTNFRDVNLKFVLTGVHRPAAESLVERFKAR